MVWKDLKPLGLDWDILYVFEPALRIYSDRPRGELTIARKGTSKLSQGKQEKSSVSKWLPSGPLPHLLLNIQSNLRIHNPESHRLFHQKQSQFYMMLLMKMKPSLPLSILNCTIKAISQNPSIQMSFFSAYPSLRMPCLAVNQPIRPASKHRL